MSHELAMLFCHAGSKVFFAQPSSGDGWYSNELLHQITGNEVFTEQHKPGWTKSRHSFDLTILIDPPDGQVAEINNGNSANPIVDYIAQKSPLVSIFSGQNSSDDFVDQKNNRFFVFSHDLKERKLFSFESFFSKQIRLLHGRNRMQNAGFHLKVSDELNSEAVLSANKLITELKNAGMLFSDAVDAKVMLAINPGMNDAEPVSSHENDAVFVNLFTQKNKHGSKPVKEPGPDNLTAFRLDHGLEIHNGEEVRLLPTVDGQCCFKRFADYICDHICQKSHEDTEQ
jgi:hypothetical protein